MPGRIILVLILLLAACAPRGALTMAPEGVPLGTVERIYIASNRDAQGQRHEAVSFGRIDVSVPPQRQPGSIPYPEPGRAPDPRRDFLVSQFARFPGDAAFRDDLRHALVARKPGDRDVVLFVHGYNNTFAEGLYRFAQFQHDLQLPGVGMHYSWPSRGEALAYAADRDSVLYSRDGLVRSIRLAAQANPGGKLILVGHSMGAELMMESLRQMAIAGDRRTLDRIGAVVLLSPDIDIGLFRMQAKAIGTLPQPFIIFTSGKDKALNLSSLISAELARLGNLTDARPVADLPVTLVDTGAYSTGSGHFNVATSPALMRILTKAREMSDLLSSDRTGLGPLAQAALHVERAAQIVIPAGF